MKNSKLVTEHGVNVMIYELTVGELQYDIYAYCYTSLGTKFVPGMREDYNGINEQDEAAKVYDLFYHLFKDVEHITKADITLMN
jgi:hypothetical protein